MSSVGNIIKKNHAVLFWSLQYYPKVKREAIYTLYALTKHFDDLCSSSLSEKEKKDIIDAWKDEVNNIYDKKVPQTQIGRKIYKNCMRFKLPKQYIEAILSSFEMDCEKPLFCPNKEEFDKYCYGVAQLPCYLMLKVINSNDDDKIKEIAKNAGCALEYTNILKNIKDDAKNGHIYLRKDYLEKAQIDINSSANEILTNTNLYIARQELAAEARMYFEKSFELLKIYKNKFKPLIYMLNFYYKYFLLMEKRGWEIISPKPKLNRLDKIRLIIQTILG